MAVLVSDKKTVSNAVASNLRVGLFLECVLTFTNCSSSTLTSPAGCCGRNESGRTICRRQGSGMRKPFSMLGHRVNSFASYS
jgi:hypothetical protein